MLFLTNVQLTFLRSFNSLRDHPCCLYSSTKMAMIWASSFQGMFSSSKALNCLQCRIHYLHSNHYGGTLLYSLFYLLSKDFCSYLRGRAKQAPCGLDSQKRRGPTAEPEVINSDQPQGLDSSLQTVPEGVGEPVLPRCTGVDRPRSHTPRERAVLLNMQLKNCRAQGSGSLSPSLVQPLQMLSAIRYSV